nr:protoheme IX farnesyltransferase [Paracoccaceae bacterium]
LIPISILPVFGITGSLQLSILAAILIVILGIWFATKAIGLFKNVDDASAKKLMFASFIYLPLLQLIYIIDRLL